MDSTPQQPPSQSERQDDWLLSPTTATEAAATPEPDLTPTDVIGDGEPVHVTDVTPRRGRSQLVGAGGLVAAGLVAGVVGTFALGHHGPSTTTFQPVGSTVQQGPGGLGQQGSGTIPGGPAGGFGGPGGVQGEEHVQGTVAGVSGSTLTVRTSSGTTSYAISSSTEVVRDGQAATLSQLRTGDPVLVHVLTGGSSPVVERVIAGTTGQGGFFGGPPGAING